MPLNFSVFFDADPRYRCYRVRIWESRHGDTKVNVPARFWREAGYKEVPREPSPKIEKVAYRWAAIEVERRERLGGVSRPRRALTLQELGDFYIARNPNAVKPLTLAKHKTTLKALVDHFGADAIPAKITEDELVVYRNLFLPKRRNRTVKNELDFLIQLLAWGYRNREKTGMRELNVLKRPKIPKQKPLGRPLTEEEIGAIMKVRLPRDGDRIVRMVLFAIATGLRRTPLLNFRDEWLDRKKKWLHVPADVMKGKAGEERPLSVPVCEWALELVGPEKRGGKPFARRDGKPNVQVDRSLWKIAKLAGITRFSLHDARRTFVTILANAGVEHAVRELLMGHAPVGVSEEFYIQRSPEVLRAAVAKIDEVRDRVLADFQAIVSIKSRRKA